MKVTITGRHMTVHDSVKTYAEQKAQKLELLTQRHVALFNKFRPEEDEDIDSVTNQLAAVLAARPEPKGVLGRAAAAMRSLLPARCRHCGRGEKRD